MHRARAPRARPHLPGDAAGRGRGAQHHLILLLRCRRRRLALLGDFEQGGGDGGLGRGRGSLAEGDERRASVEVPARGLQVAHGLGQPGEVGPLRIRAHRVVAVLGDDGPVRGQDG